MTENDSGKLIEAINIKSKELNINAVGIGNVDELEKLQDQFYKGRRFKKIREYFPEAESYISAAISYKAVWNNSPNDSAGYIARYTTANYYKILSGKLKILGQTVEEFTGRSGENFFRIFVNSRANDKLAGFITIPSWFGRNSLLIIDDTGSQTVLGEIFIPFKIGRTANNSKDKCGECRECITTCPTGAIDKNRGINKNICIQHLSSETDWPLFIKSKKFLNYWGKRFFGCTDCIDVCPYNSGKIHNLEKNQLSGNIGTNFNLNNILKFKKGDYKLFFNNNQIGASWIPEIALVRNCMASLFNLGESGIIKEFFKIVESLNFDHAEIDYLKRFHEIYL